LTDIDGRVLNNITQHVSLLPETNKFDLSKFYGIQSLEEAIKIDDHIWAMNAAILMGQCESM